MKNVLMVAAEAVPYIRTGDVANVVSGLSLQLRRQGHDVRLVIPRYRGLELETLPQEVLKFQVPLGTYTRQARVLRTEHTFGAWHLPVYLIDNPFYFEREQPYGYLDDYERFIFFARASLEMLFQEGFDGKSWQPDVIHGHDWIAGLIPFWLRHTYQRRAESNSIAFVFTIHNAGFPGQFGYRSLSVADLDELGIYTAIGESVNRISFMARGLLAADAVNTVSPRHAEEIMAGSYAGELSKAIKESARPIEGILNGLDYSLYNPAFDPEIERRFDRHTLAWRTKNKERLQQECGFEAGSDTPLLGMTSRLITEKGIGLLEAILPTLLEREQLQLVVAGPVGDYRYRETFSRFAQDHPRQLAVFFDPDNATHRRIFAGSDIILVPSLYEACGLQQMIAMRYGAVPLVRRTGGLADTVEVWNSETNAKGGQGFVFDDFEPQCLLQAIQEALALYRSQPRAWEALQSHNMDVDLSWERSAARYVDLYEQAIESRQSPARLPQGHALQPDRGESLVHAVLAIEELAMTAPRREYLKQAARSARELLASDAVLIWVRDERIPQKLRLDTYSLSRGEDGSDWDRPDLGTPLIFPEPSGRSWQYVYGLDSEGMAAHAQLGFLDSELAHSQGWAVQLTAPMNTRGGFLGRIDAFSCNDQRRFSESDIGVLSALASSLATNLEKMLVRDQRDLLLRADREMARAESFHGIVGVTLRYACDLVQADRVYFYPSQGPIYGLDADNHVEELTKIEETATQVSCRAELKADDEKVIGEIRAIKADPAMFSRDDEAALKDLAIQAANALQAAQQREQQEQNRVEQLGRLAGALAGSQDMPTLMDNIVKTIARVLRVDAASLYLADEDNTQLVIEAASGYQAPLVAAKASYAWGEGVTGRIAETGEPFMASSLEMLRERGGGSERGTFDHLHTQGQQPNSFYGLPLKVKGREKPIGVLKVESLKDRFFSSEDVQLIEMMANVIATVVYNAQLNERRLREFSANLEDLSGVLAGAKDMPTLMNNIVDKIAEVLHVDAASLFLADEDSARLIIEAASGYQAPLVAAEASYEWGEGVTGRIAETGRPFMANSLKALREEGGGSKRGTFDHLHPEGQQPNSFYGLPLKVKERDKAIGVLKVESLKDRFFSSEDVLLIEVMANVIATVVYNAQLSERRLREFSTNLGELSGVLAGGKDMPMLMDNIINTIAKVLRVDAASLFLADEDSARLIIEAASGYQAPLVAAKVSYAWGQGVTGRIAETGEPFMANSLKMLREKGGGSERGTFDHLHPEGQQPNSFYGLPLKVKGREKAIGVLKVESLKDRFFSSEDVLLIEMMANVIATVVYNAQLSEKRLREFSTNLGDLSGALAGGKDMPTLMDSIVAKIAEVLHVDAASLYLADDNNTKLIIEAAFGYQAPLVVARASYEWGQGVTGRIAETGRPFMANSLKTLRDEGGGSKRGTFDHLHTEGQQPNSFYGLPLKVKGREKPIGVLKVESLKDRFFSSEDVLLIEMMANVIATVVFNAQQDRDRLGEIIKTLGSMVTPQSAAAQQLLVKFAQSPDRGELGLLAARLADIIGSNAEMAYKEALSLLEAKARPELYSHIANATQYSHIRHRFTLFYQAVRAKRPGIEHAKVEDRTQDVFNISHLWAGLSEWDGSIQEFLPFAESFVEAFGQVCKAKITERITLGNWAGYLLDTSQTFENTYLPERLPIVFHRSGLPDDSDLNSLHELLSKKMGDLKYVVLPLWCEQDLLKRTITMLRTKFQQTYHIDTVVLDVNQTQQIVGAHLPDIELHRVVLAQVRLTRISPYTKVGPTNKNVFFGRERELGQISHGARQASFAIMGGRRIGKTSLLLQLHDIRLPSANVTTYFLDCTPDHAYEELAEMLPLLSNGGFLVLLVDEADNLVRIDRDRGWSLFAELRSLANSGRVQVVLSGEKTLRHALRDPSSPLFNLVNEVLLGPLNRQDVNDLVTRPMKQLEIEFVDEQEIVSCVWDFTSGHPNVVQRLCRRLVERLNDQGTRRITLQDVRAVTNDPGFQREDFLSTYWEKATPLEKIISLLMADDEKIRTLREVRNALDKRCNLHPRAGQVQDALQDLVDLRSILKEDPSGYEFAIEAFPRVIAGTITLDDQLQVLADEYREQGE